MLVVEGVAQFAGPGADLPTSGRPQLDQTGIDTGDLADPPSAVHPEHVDEPHPQRRAEMGFQGGAGRLRGGRDRLVHRPTVNRPPLCVGERLYLVRDRDVGVQIRIAGPVVTVVNAAATSPVTSTCSTPARPLRVFSTSASMNRKCVGDRRTVRPLDQGRRLSVRDGPQ